MLKNVLRYSGQAVLYVLFMGVIGYFSTSPAYVHFPPDQALIKASFSHAGQPKEECHIRTAEELAKLPPNMRVAMQCARERSPLEFELEIDGQPLYRAELAPAGLSRDGASTLYHRFPVTAGPHHLRAKLKDSARVPDFNYVREADVTLAPAQIFVVDFDPRRGGFVFK
jgi:hypothetical protein